jgi:hypothetical protein
VGVEIAAVAVVTPVMDSVVLSVPVVLLLVLKLVSSFLIVIPILEELALMGVLIPLVSLLVSMRVPPLPVAEARDFSANFLHNFKRKKG